MVFDTYLKCIPKDFSLLSSSFNTRILGFRRAPLVVGRYINLRTEVKPVATEQLLSTFLTVGKRFLRTVVVSTVRRCGVIEQASRISFSPKDLEGI